MTNEYEPWKHGGISELEYWRKRYLESRMETNQLYQDICDLLNARKCSDVHCVFGHSGMGTNGGCNVYKLNRQEAKKFVLDFAKDLVSLVDKWKDL